MTLTLALEHVESVNLRSAIRKADAVLPVFARAGQRSDTLKRVARRGRCRLLFRLGVQHIVPGLRGASSSPVHRALVLVLGTNIAVLLDCSKSSRQCSLPYLLTYLLTGRR